MAEEYIIKIREPAELIPKDQWDWSKDEWTFGFVLLGPGIYKEIYDDGYNPRIEEEYPVLLGITYNLNDESDSALICLFEHKNEKGKYSIEWIRSIKGALKYEVTFLLKSKEIKEALDFVKIIVSDHREFEKIVKSMALAYILYREILDEGIQPLFDIKYYYYALYKYVLKGSFDYETYLKITKVNDAIIELDANYIYGLQIRFENAYDRIKNDC
jgi:hypothetical protein